MPAFNSREEMLTALNAVLGENPTEEGLTFMANLADTHDHLTTTATNATNKYNILRKDYTNRFLTGGKGNPNDDNDDGADNDTPNPITESTYDTLFFDN